MDKPSFKCLSNAKLALLRESADSCGPVGAAVIATFPGAERVKAIELCEQSLCYKT